MTMKVLISKSKSFEKDLDNLLYKRRKKIISDKVSVTKIIKDVKSNGDKALIKYEKRFNKNNNCLLYTSPSPRDQLTSRMPSSA